MLYERHVIFRCVLLAYSLWLLRMRSSVRKENIDLPMVLAARGLHQIHGAHVAIVAGAM